jgi:3,4-dihydroxy 2-butanone 4-phosphate synthase/GTP cyclohydrolase II
MGSSVVNIGFDQIADAIAAISTGEMVVVLDDKNRENEGDLVIAAEFATPEALAFIVRHGTGIVCIAMTGTRLDELELPPMVEAGNDRHQTAFTVTVDYRHGTQTGVSAADRAKTIAALIDPSTAPTDLMRPGHMFPLRARPGGVIERRGHTEAAVDLARLAGCVPAGVLCEVVLDDGSMARAPDLLRFARQHGLRMITIADLVHYLEKDGTASGRRRALRPAKPRRRPSEAAAYHLTQGTRT